MINCDEMICINDACHRGNVGSYSKIALIDIKSIDLESVTQAGGIITAATITDDWVTISFNKNAASTVEAIAVDLVSGGGLVTQTITITVPYRQVSTRNAITGYAQGNRNLWLSGLDGNGIWWLFGKEFGVNLTDVQSVSSETKSIGSHYVLTFVGEERELAPSIDSDLIEMSCGETE